MSKGYSKGYKQAHTTWECMLSRCYKKYDKDYHRYGGKGITVCAEWHDFRNFVRDMGFPPDDPETGQRLTLDRIDGTKGYYKNNCRWANRSQQNKNRLPRFYRPALDNDESPSPDFEITLSGILITLKSAP